MSGRNFTGVRPGHFDLSLTHEQRLAMEPARDCDSCLRPFRQTRAAQFFCSACGCDLPLLSRARIPGAYPTDPDFCVQLSEEAAWER